MPAITMAIGLWLMGCMNRTPQVALDGYDLAKPVVHAVPQELNEISGIAFAGGNPDTVYAIQDEKGILFTLALQQGTLQTYKFGKKGDYEDLAIIQNRVVVLRSDGTLFQFDLQQRSGAEETNITESKGLLAEGEFESLAAGNNQGALYLLCKTCAKSHGRNKTRGFQLVLDSSGVISLQQEFSATLKDFDPAIAAASVKPSAMAQHPLTGDWYVLCSVGKYLLVYTADWKPLRAVPVAPSVFTQPEGMAFDSKGDLFISNEASAGQKANILRFDYRPQP
jgi:uncharacterized protein YjiK